MTPAAEDLRGQTEFFLGYIAPKENGSHDVFVLRPPLSAESLSEYQECTKIITALQPLVIALAICERDLEALAALSASQARRLTAIGSPEIPTSLVMDLLVESTAGANALLASTSAFIVQAEIEVTRMFGAGSACEIEWQRRRRTLHAGSVGYRIVYDLRNFAQHYGLPLSAISIDGSRSDPDGPMQLSSVSRVHRDKLLATGFKWGSRRADIEAQNAEFDLLPLAEEYMQCLRTLLLDIARERANELVLCRDYLVALRRMLKPPAQARIFLFNGSRISEVSPPTSGEIVPEGQFSWLLKKLDAFKTAGAREVS